MAYGQVRSKIDQSAEWRMEGCQHTLLKVDQALFIVDMVDQERAPNESNQFRARAAPGKARHVRLLHTTEGEATEVVQPEGESHGVWKSFGYTLGSVLSVVADRCDFFDRPVKLRESLEAGPNTASSTSA